MSAKSLSPEALAAKIARITEQREELVARMYYGTEPVHPATAERFIALHGDALAELHDERAARGLE